MQRSENSYALLRGLIMIFVEEKMGLHVFFLEAQKTSYCFLYYCKKKEKKTVRQLVRVPTEGR
jgi:hypothetical protein